MKELDLYPTIQMELLLLNWFHSPKSLLPALLPKRLRILHLLGNIFHVVLEWSLYAEDTNSMLLLASGENVQQLISGESIEGNCTL